MAATASGAAAFSYNASTHFSDTDALTYTITSLVYGTGDPSTWVAANWTAAGLAINASTGVITGTPDVNDQGTVYITVTATDTGMSSVSESFELFLHDGTYIIGTTGADTVTNQNKYFGDLGGDTVSGTNGADTVHSGDGADSIDTLFDTTAVIYGGAGNDTLLSGNGSDRLYGGDDDDTLSGGGGTDKLFGGEGGDNLSGGSGNDTLYGGFGNDTLSGGNSNDFLDGQEGADTLTGGAGNDTFVFTSTAHSTNAAPDRITDFTNGSELIKLTGLGFTALSDFETLSLAAGVTTLADTQTSFAITFTGDVTALLDNTDFIF